MLWQLHAIGHHVINVTKRFTSQTIPKAIKTQRIETSASIVYLYDDMQ